MPLQRRDGLSKAQYRAVVAAIAAVHVVGIWGILQVPAVRAQVLEAAPIFVDLLAPPSPPVPVPPPPPPPVKPVIKPPEPRVITTAPSPAPAQFEAPPAPEVPAPPAPPVAVEAPPAPPAPPPPPPPPKVIPAEAVQYLVRPAGEYPRMSIRMGETGLVMVRVYIDEGGMPRQVLVEKSSGFPRLDEAAVVAVRGARFKPYLYNGAPTPGWARIPIPFELEK